jgi:hypothetical protein
MLLRRDHYLVCPFRPTNFAFLAGIGGEYDFDTPRQVIFLLGIVL